MLTKFGTEKPSTWTTSFVLDTAKLTRLWSEINARFTQLGATPTFNFTVGFRDKRRERRASVEEVVNLENRRNNPVTDMSIVASGATAQGKSLSCSIEFSNEQRNNVRLAVKGADPMVTNDIHAALDERVQATFAKNWGQLVAALTLMVMLVGVLVLLVNFGEPSLFYSALTSKDFAELNQMAEHANSEAAQLGFIFEMHRREIRAHVNRAAPMELTIG